MRLIDEVRRRGKAAILPVLCTSAIVYFGYYLIYGGQGLYAYARLRQQVEIAQNVVKSTAAARDRLAQRIALLQPDHIDPDMLSELARRDLNLAQPDDLVIFFYGRASNGPAAAKFH